MLHNIRVASPCSAAWNKMEGDDRIRFCKACQLNVYNFSEMTEREVRQLIQNQEGRRLCGRLYRRKDGTILTRNCPVGLRAIVRRLSRVAGAILSFMTPSFAAAQTQTNIQSSDRSASLELHVVDIMGVDITNVEITLTQSGGKKPVTAKADSQGRLRLSGLADGDYEIKVAATGFATYESHLSLNRKEPVFLRLALNLPASMGEVVEVSPPATASAGPSAQNKAQNSASNTGIEILVADPSGAVVSNAKVTLKQTNGKPIEGKTDAGGRVSFRGLATGDYLLRINLTGFKIFEKPVAVNVGGILTVQAQLRPSEENMGVIVTAEPVLVDRVPR